ncbi:preprotein translocase subunit YajC [Chitinophagaceae bacterium MMS25-I14]
MFVNLQTVLLQAPGGGSFQLIFLVGMIAVMYFFMIRPQAKRAKEQKKFAESMNPGDKIVTTAGIHATISRTNDDGTLKIEVSNGTFMTIERSAISMEMTAAARKKAEGGSAVVTK